MFQPELVSQVSSSLSFLDSNKQSQRVGQQALQSKELMEPRQSLNHSASKKYHYKKFDSESSQNYIKPALKMINREIISLSNFISVLTQKIEIEKQYTEKLQNLTKMHSFVEIVQSSNYQQSNKIIKQYLQTFQSQYQMRQTSYKQIYHQQLYDLIKQLQKDIKLLANNKSKLIQISEQKNNKTEQFISSYNGYRNVYQKLKMNQYNYFKQRLSNTSGNKANSKVVKINNIRNDQFNTAQKRLQKQRNKLIKAYDEYIDANYEMENTVLDVDQTIAMLSKQFLIAYNQHNRSMSDKMAEIYLYNIQKVQKQQRNTNLKSQQRQNMAIPSDSSIVHYTSTLYQYVSEKDNLELTKFLDLKLSEKQIVSESESSFNESFCLPQEDIGHIPSQIVKEMAGLFQNIFGKKQCQKDQFNRLVQRLKNNKQMKKLFLIALQNKKYSNLQQLRSQKDGQIASILNIILEQCQKERDILNSQKLMKLSQNFSFIMNGKQVGLYHFIKANQIFHNIQWWECAIFFDCFQAIYFGKQFDHPHLLIKKYKQKQKTLMASIKGSGPKKEQQKFQRTLINILNSHIQYMRIFELGQLIINSVVCKFVTLFEIKLDHHDKVNQILRQDIIKIMKNNQKYKKRQELQKNTFTGVFRMFSSN